jgi:hypothetical protein
MADIKRILIVAQNQNKAQDAEKIFKEKGLKCDLMYPNYNHVHRHFEALVVYHTKQTEVNFVKDTLQTYTDVPVKAFFGKEPYSQAEQQFKTKAFSWE